MSELPEVLPATGTAGLAWLLHAHAASALDSKLGSVVFLAVVGLADAAVFLAVARLLRIAEVTELVQTVTRRIRVPGRR